MNVKELMKRFLEEEGFKYEWDEENWVFKFQGLKVILFLNENHETLLSLGVAYGAEEIPRYVALDLCNKDTIDTHRLHRHILCSCATA